MDEGSQLIRRAKAGPKDALNAVFERYGNRLLGLIRLRLGPRLRNQLESRDIVQATLLKAFRRIDQFEGSGSRTMMAWLGSIAQNEIRDQADFHRRQRRDAAREVPLDEGLNEVEQSLRSEVSRRELEVQARRLERALEALSENHREIILLRKLEELSFTEIAQRLGKTPDACRMMLSRATEALALQMIQAK